MLLAHLLVYSSSVGWLDQDLVSSGSNLSDVSRREGCPSLPNVNVLPPDSHDTLVVLIASLATQAARRAPTLQVSEESEHGFPLPAFGQKCE